MKKNILFTFVLLFLFSTFLSAQNIEQLINDSEKYYKEFNNDKQLDILKKAEKIDPNNWEVVWRLSRVFVDIGEKMPNSTSTQEDAQIETYKKGLEYAEKAVKLESNKSVSYLRRAIANGRIALFKGIFSVAGVVNSVRADVEKAIQLNNGDNFAMGVAHYVLAKTHAKTSEKWKPARSVIGLGWADNEIAIAEYKKAIQIYPGYIMFYVDYANSLVREDEYQKAREMLNKALSCSKLHQDDDKKTAEAKKMLNDIKDE
jgi:tetratricopeptide (TPR) repeat protein